MSQECAGCAVIKVAVSVPAHGICVKLDLGLQD